MGGPLRIKAGFLYGVGAVEGLRKTSKALDGAANPLRFGAGPDALKRVWVCSGQLRVGCGG